MAEFEDELPDFKDNLPLDGEVTVPRSDEIFIYLGFEADNTRRCALRPKGWSNIVWFDRTVITPVEQKRG